MTATSTPTRTTGVDVDTAPLRLADFVGESAILLGAGSAVMNQLAMKGVGLGVAEHSTTLERPLDRLRTTLTYVYVMALGTPEEQRAVARMVNKAHRPVQSRGRYSAFDPELQLWVAATLVQGGEQMYQKTFGGFDPASAEAIYRDSLIYGTALQVTEEMWPADRAGFDAYWRTSLEKLEPDPSVQCYAKRLLATERVVLPLKPLIWLQSLMTRGNLDPRVREVLALPWSRTDQRLYDAFWAVFPPLYRRVPKAIRQLRSRMIMRDMRRRMKHGRRVI
jgi:uncharacterized protein (DUF2236 family)